MPPRVQICLCRAHGCADADRTSTITGRVLKGKCLSDMEFRAHQRDEKSAKRSARNPFLGPTEDGPSTVHPITHPLPSPGSPAVTVVSELEADTSPNREPVPISCDTLPHQPSDTSPEVLCPDDTRYSSSKHAPDLDSVGQPSLSVARNHDEGNLNPCPRRAAGQCNASRSTDPLPCHVMQAIESCRLDFQSWQRADIPCDELVFEETTAEEPLPHIPLRVDITSNTEFIEYEAVMFALLDRIDRIVCGGCGDCEVARQNVFSSVEDEIDRLRGMKLHIWKSRATDGSFGSAVPRSGPFREIDTGMEYIEFHPQTDAIYLTNRDRPLFRADT